MRCTKRAGILEVYRDFLAAEELMDWFWPEKGSAIKLLDVNDPKFTPRILADPQIEGRIAILMFEIVKNGPTEWLIHDKHIMISRAHHFSLSAGRPFPDGPLIVVTLPIYFLANGSSRISYNRELTLNYLNRKS